MKNLIELHVDRIEINGEKHLIIKIPYDKDLIKVIKKIKGIRWNRKNKYWHTKESLKKIDLIFQYFNGMVLIKTGDPFLKKRFHIQSQFGKLT